LADVLGGRTGAVDAGVPAVSFVTVWALAGALVTAGDAVLWGAGAALLAGVVLAGVRLARGRRPAAVVLGLLGVVVAALVVLRTGRAADFFLLQIAANAASALAWLASIAVRWPLLGVIAGLALGQRARWRADPDLLRGYCRASWVWVAQYLARLAVFIPLYRADQVVALGAARGLTWVPVLVCVGLSWPVMRTALPDGHPGFRYPRTRSGEAAHDL
jgi:xanthosine utilization system XapX-like protein